MTTQIEGSFTECGNQLVWREVHTFPIKDTGCVYLTRKPSDEEHMVYKLTAVPGTKQYYWQALWNTCARTDKNFDSMEEAIRCKIKQGWLVIQTNFSEFFHSPFKRQAQ
jgi:hypothetical protein